MWLFLKINAFLKKISNKFTSFSNKVNFSDCKGINCSMFSNSFFISLESFKPVLYTF